MDFFKRLKDQVDMNDGGRTFNSPRPQPQARRPIADTMAAPQFAQRLNRRIEQVQPMQHRGGPAVNSRPMQYEDGSNSFGGRAGDSLDDFPRNDYAQPDDAFSRLKRLLGR